jgi:outer membrane protein OmpA-like peptidoglycan-associated protein
MTIRPIAAALTAALLLSACATPGGPAPTRPAPAPPATTPQTAGGSTQPAEPGMSNKAKGAAIGAIIGAIAGVATGDDAKERRNRALIGAGVGALAGVAVGSYMDEQERKLKEQLANSGVGVRREGDNIVLEMPGSITFATNSSDVRAEFYGVLNSVSTTMKEYDRTTIDVVGHTDDVGTDAYNQALSERRAQSVAAYINNQGVNPVRVVAIGRGESQPVDSNASEDGRARNRRVELTLTPIEE